jgi:hypothetical protein
MSVPLSACSISEAAEQILTTFGIAVLSLVINL